MHVRQQLQCCGTAGSSITAVHYQHAMQQLLECVCQPRQYVTLARLASAHSMSIAVAAQVWCFLLQARLLVN